MLAVGVGEIVNVTLPNCGMCNVGVPVGMKMDDEGFGVSVISYTPAADGVLDAGSKMGCDVCVFSACSAGEFELRAIHPNTMAAINKIAMTARYLPRFFGELLARV